MMYPASFSVSDDEPIKKHEKNVKVFVRILPLVKPCESCAKISSDNKTIYVRCLQDMRRHKSSTNSYPMYWTFPTDGIFQEVSQDKVYRATTKDLVKKVLNGINCVLIGYGQTGSGKSFTIGGLKNTWEHRGIIPRLLSDMFEEKIIRRKINDIRYRLSFLQLRGKDVTDLLTTQKRKINIGEHDVFKHVTIVDIGNEEESLKKILEGDARRSIVKGTMHYPILHLGAAVITLHVSNTSLINHNKSQVTIATSKIHVVEMAGTGTAGKSDCSKTATDLGMANLMKTQLEQYFVCLREPNRYGASMCSVVHSSNLLKLLKDALTVTSVIRFISHVRITKEDLDVTLSTMRLTAKIAKLKLIKTIQHVRPQAELIVQQLREEVNALRKELELNDMFLHQEALMNISKARAEQIERDIMNFLQGSISELTLFNVTQARVLMKTVKQLYDKLIVEGIRAQKLDDEYENMEDSLAQANATSSTLLSKEI